MTCEKIWIEERPTRDRDSKQQYTKENEEKMNFADGEHYRAKPMTVSSTSTSSIETAGSLHSDRIKMFGTQNVSSEPSLIRSTPATTRSIQYDPKRISPPTTSASALPSSISLVHNPLRSPSTGVVIPSVASPNAVPEFLYQLTKMLTDNNRDIIEWSNGKIEVHNPHKLESHVLNRYFRHSKFASFQRQLNYFGFRKLAGKGKMAPCSYTNDATTNELRSLLHIKRKTGNEPKSKAAEKKRVAAAIARSMVAGNKTARQSFQSGESTTTKATTSTPQHTQQQAIARVAVGKGIRHGFSMPKQTNGIRSLGDSDTSSTAAAAAIEPNPVQSSLNDLQTNYQTSLQQKDTSPRAAITTATSSGNLAYVPGSLRRDDSLVDLAMIPLVDPSGTDQKPGTAGSAMPFIDFPWDSSILFQDEEPLT